MDIQQILINLLQSNSNPFITNLLSLGQKGDVKELEKIAKNMCSQKNLNFDNELNKVKSNPFQFFR